MSDIEELDDTAQLLRVSWRKANNYYASFTRTLFETKVKLDSGVYGPEWTFSRWLLRKAGLFEDQVMRQLTIFLRAAAAEERENIERENKRIRDEKRALAEKERQEKAAEKAIKSQEKEQERQEKQRLEKENLLEKQRLEAEKEREREALRAYHEARRKQQEEEQKAALRAKKRAAAAKGAKRVTLPPNGPSPEAHTLLAECAEIEKKSAVELGRRYAALKERVDLQQEGKDANGKWWTWTAWANAYIPHNVSWIRKCIQRFNDAETLNRSSRAVTQEENVVRLH